MLVDVRVSNAWFVFGKWIFLFVHSCLWGYCVIKALDEPYGQMWIFVWNPLLWLDFPVTILGYLGMIVIPDALVEWFRLRLRDLSGSYPLNYFGFWYLGGLYGVFGSLWFYNLPKIIGRFYCFFRRAVERYVARK